NAGACERNLNWILTSLLSLLLVELALRLPFASAVATAGRSSTRALHVVRAKAISDHWKEKAMAAYARSTFLASVQLVSLLAILFGTAFLLVVALERVSGGFQGFILGWRGIAFSVAVASLYVVARRALARGGL